MRHTELREKEGSAAKRAAKRIWRMICANFGYKALALVTALLLWLAAGYLTRPQPAAPAPEATAEVLYV